ncbi:MAG: hypothetical protein F6K50_00565 [Moorea sp. SIO3I7]|nr:hypothetical protein [Moorena sp. SIO3I7]NEO11902.1 hypothetical protein [Moorena sp. SIO3E8]
MSSTRMRIGFRKEIAIAGVGEKPTPTPLPQQVWEMSQVGQRNVGVSSTMLTCLYINRRHSH